jgi:LCP family protein required for cell wall assembly
VGLSASRAPIFDSNPVAPAATSTPAATPVDSTRAADEASKSLQPFAGGWPGPTWPGTQPVTVLVLGEDHRQGDTERFFQTDTMMLISIDPAAKTISMVSIPRDLWVDIPGSGAFKIDDANFIGDAYHYPGGGPALAVNTVQQNFNVQVDHYFRLDFTAFETFIDAIGGIDIVNAQTIDDPTYPDGSLGYEPFYLPAGPHHLNGHDALRYARTRHGSTDMARARRQQEVILAVRQKVLSLNLLPGLVAQAPSLYQTLNQSVSTDLSLQQMIALALMAQDVSQDHIQSAVIDYNYVQNGLEPGAPGDPPQQVLIANWDRIHALMKQMIPPAADALGSHPAQAARP